MLPLPRPCYIFFCFAAILAFWLHKENSLFNKSVSAVKIHAVFLFFIVFLPHKVSANVRISSS